MDLLEYVLNMPSLLNFFFLGPHDSIFSRVIRIIGKYAVEVLEKDDSGIKDLLWIEVLVNDLDNLVFRDSMDETAEDVGEKVIADGFLVDDTGADFGFCFTEGSLRGISLSFLLSPVVRATADPNGALSTVSECF